MASAWGSAWANAWGDSWGATQQETVVIVGGDDAPGHKRRKRKESHELFSELEATVHHLLNPQVGDVGTGSVSSDVPPADISRVDELLVLAQGQHERLQRAASLRADLRALQENIERERIAALQQDDDEMMMLS